MNSEMDRAIKQKEEEYEALKQELNVLQEAHAKLD